MMIMSNVCIRRGKIEWKRVILQVVKLELEKIQVGCVYFLVQKDKNFYGLIIFFLMCIVEVEKYL